MISKENEIYDIGNETNRWKDTLLKLLEMRTESQSKILELWSGKVMSEWFSCSGKYGTDHQHDERTAYPTHLLGMVSTHISFWFTLSVSRFEP